MGLRLLTAPLLLCGWITPGAAACQSAANDASAPPFPESREPRTHLVQSGLAWHLVASDSIPGDVILLEKGFHISGRIEDLHGTRERPIVIRGADPGTPSAIACDETGIELLRCSWIRLENLYFINARSAAIVIDGTPAARTGPVAPAGAESGSGTADSAAPRGDGEPPDLSIAIAACRFATSREIPGMDGIRITNGRNIGIAQCQFDNWSRAAISIERASAVVITRCAFAPQAIWPHACGVRIRGDSRFVAVHLSTFERGILTGVQAGGCEVVDGRDPTPSPAREVHVSRSLMLEVECPIEVGPGAEVSLIESTIVDPRVAYRLDATCGSPGLTIASSLFQWEPGRVRTLADLRGEVAPELVRLDRNLWWSDELPLAFEVIGRPFGTEISPQVTNLNPRLAEKLFQPTDPQASEFGWAAPPPRNPPGEAAGQPAAAPGSAGTGGSAIPPARSRE